MSTLSDQRFVAFVDARSPELLRIARHLTGDADNARDLTQSALERAYRRWHRLDDEDDPFGYVRQILIHLHIDGWRRSSRVPSVTAPTRSPADPAEVWRQHAAIAEVLAPLAPRERAVVVLRFCEDLSEADVAAELGMSVGTVKSTTHRALAKLRVITTEGSRS